MNAVAPNRGHDADARPPLRERVLRLFAPLFHRLLDRIDAGLTQGAIEATLPDGRKRLLGGCGRDGPVAVVELRRWRALLRLMTGGSAGWYVAWKDGDWASPDPVALFDLFMRNARTLGGAGRSGGFARVVRHARNRLFRNHRAGARRNIEFHYDLGNDFYAAWLDPGMTYSSALFTRPGLTLEQAQTEKLEAMWRRVAPGGESILEIGCGWGSFMAHVAGRSAVTGITLSARQKYHVKARLGGDADVRLLDYRDVTGTYDAVVSIEMVEAVGQGYWPDYLAAIDRALKPGGRAAIQYIAIDDAIFDAYAANVDFIQRFVFPGGMLLSERRFRALAEARHFAWEDQVSFGADYAETLRRWREAFDAAVSEGRLTGNFDSDFIALWRYYLMYCEGGFRGGGITVAQVTLVKRA